jgi:propanol-preferring alcohol dehydrogenase
MLAARFYGIGEPLKLEEVERPNPGPGEVLVRIRACGLCGSDLHLIFDKTARSSYLPITPGHESAGEIFALGAEVNGWKVGDRVAIIPQTWCGSCFVCLEGRSELCENGALIGFGREGALAEYINIPAQNLIKIPAGVPYDQAAVVTDAVATPFHALTSVGKLKAGESVAIFGVGGLGMQAVQLARLAGAAWIIAVDLRADALERARSFGADDVVNAAEEDAVEAIRQKTNGRGVDLALEVVGYAKTVEQAMRCLRPGGRAVISGVGTEKAQMPPQVLFVSKGYQVLGSYGFSGNDVKALLDLVASGRLDLAPAITHTFPLTQVNEALDTLYRKVGNPIRVVVTQPA